MEIKNITDEFNCRLDTAKETQYDLEDKSEETIRMQRGEGRRMENPEERVRETEGYSKEV